MRKILIASFVFLLGSASAQNTDSLLIKKIFDEALVNGSSYPNLSYLCKNIGARPSGSVNSQKAIEWGRKLMEGYAFDRVYLQSVVVPHWERGEKEKAEILEGGDRIKVPVCALGGSVSTPSKGLIAEVIEVNYFEDLEQIGERYIRGKIVFFNRPFDETLIRTENAYLGAIDQLKYGAQVAAKYGAYGVIIRSATNAHDDIPHTGNVEYSDAITPIPAAAISTKAADLLSAKLAVFKIPSIRFSLKQSCHKLADETSYNVIGEIRGSENPSKIITIGAHLDSWDLGEGAHDNGAGCVQAIEVLRIFKTLGIKPKNTIRVVLFADEEDTNVGSKEYAELVRQNKEESIAVLETNLGGFSPRGFSVDANPKQYAAMEKYAKILAPYGAGQLDTRFTGSDNVSLKYRVIKEENKESWQLLSKDTKNIPLITYRPDDQRYYDIHHSVKDVLESVNRRELSMGAASISSLVYLLDQYGIE